MDKSRISSNRLSKAYNEGVDAFLEFAQSNNPKLDEDSGHDEDDSGHDEDSKLQRGQTIGSKASKGKPIITYNKRGVPIGAEAKKLASFEGKAARTMVPITYASWLDVGEETKEELWRHVSAHFVVDPKRRKQTLQSIGTKWKTFKYNLYQKFIKKQKNDPKANLLNPPNSYRFLKKKDWKLFIAQRISKEWQDKSSIAKNVRAHYKYNHHLSRKGYVGLIDEIMQQTGKTEEEIDRAMLWKKARELKTGGFDSNVQIVVDRIDELHNSESFDVTSGTQDVLTHALGTEEQRGHVRGMGKFVKPHQYFFLPKTVKEYMDTEKQKVDQRFNKIEAELEKLKRGTNDVSEGTSCQMWGNGDFEEELLVESLDDSCYLAVGVASNIVAKGTIMNDGVSGGNIEVLMETCVQGEALLPIPLEEEFIEKVKDAVGHILSWPTHLVILCSDLEKMVATPIRKRLREPVDEENKNGKERKKENGKESSHKDEERMEIKKEKGKELECKKQKKRFKEG